MFTLIASFCSAGKLFAFPKYYIISSKSRCSLYLFFVYKSDSRGSFYNFIHPFIEKSVKFWRRIIKNLQFVLVSEIAIIVAFVAGHKNQFM